MENVLMGTDSLENHVSISIPFLSKKIILFTIFPGLFYFHVQILAFVFFLRYT